MSAVLVTRCADGYTLSCKFRSLAAASRGLDALLLVSESAYEPAPQPDPVLSRLEVAIEVAEADDPPPHDGRINPPNPNTGD